MFLYSRIMHRLMARGRLECFMGTWRHNTKFVSLIITSHHKNFSLQCPSPYCCVVIIRC